MSNQLLRQTHSSVSEIDPPPAPVVSWKWVTTTVKIPNKTYLPSFDLVYVGGIGMLVPVPGKEVITGYTTSTVKELVKVVSPVHYYRRPVITKVTAAWDAAARSLDILTAPMECGFIFPGRQSDGIAGISYVGTDMADLQLCVQYGFRATGTTVTLHAPMIPGFTTAGGAVARNIAYLVSARSWSTSSEFAIRVLGRRVLYVVDGVVVATEPYYFPPGMPLVLRGVLYGTNDSVVDPYIIPLVNSDPDNRGEGTIALVGIGGSGRYGQGSGFITVHGEGDNKGGTGVIRVYGQGGSREPGGHGAGVLPGLEGEGVASIEHPATGSGFITVVGIGGGEGGYSQGQGFLMLYGSGDSYDDTPRLAPLGFASMQLSDTVPPMIHNVAQHQASAGARFTEAYVPARSVRMGARVAVRAKASQLWDERMRMGSVARSTFLGERVLAEVLLVGADAGLSQSYAVIVTERLSMGADASTALQGERIVDGTLLASAAAGAPLDSSAELAELIRMVVEAGSVQVTPGQNLQVWAVNADTDGSTQYESYPFNSFAEVDGRQFALGPEGLYELGGDTDAGAPIRASVHLGKLNFGSNNLKGITNAYLEVGSQMPMRVRVTTPEGCAYEYCTRSSSPAMKTQRVDLGRGLRATFFELEIYNQAGSAFDLNSIEFLLAQHSRRI